MTLLQGFVDESRRYTAEATAQERLGKFFVPRVLTTNNGRVQLVQFGPNFMRGTYQCDCQQFNDQLFPCCHAASALQKTGRNVTDDS